MDKELLERLTKNQLFQDALARVSDEAERKTIEKQTIEFYEKLLDVLLKM